MELECWKTKVMLLNQKSGSLLRSQGDDRSGCSQKDQGLRWSSDMTGHGRGIETRSQGCQWQQKLNQHETKLNSFAN